MPFKFPYDIPLNGPYDIPLKGPYDIPLKGSHPPGPLKAFKVPSRGL